ncbi:MAG TPA: C45 family peptidase [Thermoplasmata archaeon]|nr:C45 family peptidase [Thermoplasmata archaeon]
MGRIAVEEGFREVTASGSHHQIGVTLGKKCRDQALRMEKRWRNWISMSPDTTVKSVIAYSKRSLPMTREFYPQYVEELEGYAEGSGLDFDVVYALLCDVPGLGRGRGCTDIAVSTQWTKDDCVFAVHNEDVCPYNYADISIAKVRPTDEPGFIALAYGGIQPTAGMNAAGISLTGNAVVPNDTRLGIPKMVPCRKVLRESGIYQALRASMPEGRGHSFNNIVCDSNGEIYSMEGSATTFDALYAEEGWMIHTNHYLSPKMWKFEDNLHTRFSSIMRYNRARKLFKKELGQVDLSTFLRVLSDHVGYPESICRHPDPELGEEDQTRTIFTVAFDLTNKAAWISAGNPCKGTFKKYEL